MELVLLAIAAVIVIVVALLMVGSAVGKTTSMPAQIVINAEESIEFCAEALPAEVTSVISYDELRRLLRLHLEWIQAYHWAPEGDGRGPIVFEELDAADYMVERADTIGLDVSREHLVAVIGAHSSYLQVMGAIHLEDPVTSTADLAELPMLSPADVPSAIDDPDTGSPDTGSPDTGAK